MIETERDKKIEWNKKVELFNKCIRESFRLSGYDEKSDLIFFGVTAGGFKKVLLFDPDEDNKEPWSLEDENFVSIFKSNDLTDILFNKDLIKDDEYSEDTWEAMGHFLDLNILKEDEEKVRSFGLYPLGINMRCGNLETNTDRFITFRHNKKPTT
jgi:hypothetical protein